VLPLLLLIAAAGWDAYFYQANGWSDRETTPAATPSSPRPASQDSTVANAPATIVPSRDTTSSAPQERAIADAPETAKSAPGTVETHRLSR
jgi:hypothetical protein